MSEDTNTPPHKSRLAALEDMQVLDSGSEAFYDDITHLTAALCEAPICLISLVDEDRQWFKSEVGLCLSETVIEQSICVHAVQQNSYLEVFDTQLDPRTQDNVLCRGSRPIRFYAGAPLKTTEGLALGTLCVLDYMPRQLTKLQRRALEIPANIVTRHLEFTRTLVRRELVPATQDLDAYKATQAEFESLTPREKDVLKLIAGPSASLSSKQIAAELGISHRTVHHHRAHIMTKMKVTSVAELITKCLKAELYD